MASVAVRCDRLEAIWLLHFAAARVARFVAVILSLLDGPTGPTAHRSIAVIILSAFRELRLLSSIATFHTIEYIH